MTTKGGAGAATSEGLRTNGGTVKRVPVQTSTDQRASSMTCRHTSLRPMEWSRWHPMIPKHYVPPWQQDMVNRERIVQNAKQAGCAGWEGHNTVFQEKRERLYPEDAPPDRFAATERREQLRPPIASPFSRYTSGLLTCKH
ncbi:uncharacterized protein LOC135813918 [Sycon ciliatum]|uniref:uncharacterized protein LOC135813918 n=1 Tax=Sycon ciliatum TaxID=27933 RepID=UPI0031F6769A